MNWIKEVDGHLDMLDEEYRLIADELGIDSLIKLIELFNKTRIYFSQERFDAIRRTYIIRNRDKNIRELMRILDVSDTYIYNVMRDANVAAANQTKMEL